MTNYDLWLDDEFNLPSEDASPDLVPHSEYAEESVLGAILLNPAIMESLKGFLEIQDFYMYKHQIIYEAMLALHSQGITIDYVTLTHELAATQRLDEIGGSAEIIKIINTTPTHTHYDSYGALVFRSAMRRYLLEYATETAAIASSPKLDILTGLDEINAKLTRLNTRLGQFEYQADDSAGTMAELIVENIIDGIPAKVYKTGVEPLDTALDGGLERGTFMVVAGFTGHGKTKLMKQIALNMAIPFDKDLGRRLNVLYLALEGSKLSITRQLLSQMTGVNTSFMKNALVPPNPECRNCDGTGLDAKGKGCDCHLNYGRAYHELMMDASAKLKDHYRVDIIGSTLTVPNAKRLIMRKHRERPLDVVIIDYLQIIDQTGYNSKREAVSAFADLAVQMAVDLNCMVLAGSQFNREHTIDTNKVKEIIPQVNDLAESSQIEKNADYVISPVRAYNEIGELTTETKLWYLKLRDTSPKPYSSLEYVPNRSSFGLKHFPSRFDKKGK